MKEGFPMYRIGLDIGGTGIQVGVFVAKPKQGPLPRFLPRRRGKICI
jgi:hypothetical protein